MIMKLLPSSVACGDSVPLAVPEKRFGHSLILAFFDRCAVRASLLPPPAALGADAPEGEAFGESIKAFPWEGSEAAPRE